jgi:hypothetical protein
MTRSFQLFENALDGVPILVGDVLESERVTIVCRLQLRCAVNYEHRVGNKMFLADSVRNISVIT